MSATWLTPSRISSAPATATTATSRGVRAATTPRKTRNSSTSMTGRASVSPRSRSSWAWSWNSSLAVSSPPTRTRGASTARSRSPTRSTARSKPPPGRPVSSSTRTRTARHGLQVLDGVGHLGPEGRVVGPAAVDQAGDLGPGARHPAHQVRDDHRLGVVAQAAAGAEPAEHLRADPQPDPEEQDPGQHHRHPPAVDEAAQGGEHAAQHRTARARSRGGTWLAPGLWTGGGERSAGWAILG